MQNNAATFKFQVLSVEKLHSANACVLSGEVLTGAVQAGQRVSLDHEGSISSLGVAGVVMGENMGATDSRAPTNRISLVFKLDAMDLAEVSVGDTLLTTSPEEIRSTFAAIADPANSHLFSMEAVSKAFAHVNI